MAIRVPMCSNNVASTALPTKNATRPPMTRLIRAVAVEHEQEHAEEQQRGAEVALDHDDAEAMAHMAAIGTRYGMGGGGSARPVCPARRAGRGSRR